MVSIIRDLRIGININRLILILGICFVHSLDLYGQILNDSSKLESIHWYLRKQNPFFTKNDFVLDIGSGYENLFGIPMRKKEVSVKSDSSGCIRYSFGNVLYYEKRIHDTLCIYVYNDEVFYWGMYLPKSKFLLLWMGPGFMKGNANPPDFVGYIISIGDLGVFYCINNVLGNEKSIQKLEHNKKKILCTQYAITETQKAYIDEEKFSSTNLNELLSLIPVKEDKTQYCSKYKYKNLFDFYFTRGGGVLK